MVLLEKALRAADQNPALDDPETVYVEQRQAYEEDAQRVGWLGYWWACLKNCLVQDVPEELAFCEFECRDPACLQGGCKNPQKPVVQKFSRDD